MAPARIFDSTPIEELAMEYVILEEEAGLTDDIFDDSFDLMQRMLGRCGPEHTDAHIEKARKGYRLLNPRPDLTFKWYAGLVVKPPGRSS